MIYLLLIVLAALIYSIYAACRYPYEPDCALSRWCYNFWNGIASIIKGVLTAIGHFVNDFFDMFT